MANCKLTQQNFELFQGNTATIAVNVVDCDEAAVNLNGITVAEWKVSRDRDCEDYVIEKDLVAGVRVVDALTGLVEIDIFVADTENLEDLYYHTLTITDGSGNVVTVLEGSMLVKRR